MLHKYKEFNIKEFIVELIYVFFYLHSVVQSTFNCTRV